METKIKCPICGGDEDIEQTGRSFIAGVYEDNPEEQMEYLQYFCNFCAASFYVEDNYM